MPIRPIRPHKRPIDGQASSSGETARGTSVHLPARQSHNRRTGIKQVPPRQLSVRTGGHISPRSSQVRPQIAPARPRPCHIPVSSPHPQCHHSRNQHQQRRTIHQPRIPDGSHISRRHARQRPRNHRRRHKRRQRRKRQTHAGTDQRRQSNRHGRQWQRTKLRGQTQHRQQCQPPGFHPQPHSASFSFRHAQACRFLYNLSADDFSLAEPNITPFRMNHEACAWCRQPIGPARSGISRRAA